MQRKALTAQLEAAVVGSDTPAKPEDRCPACRADRVTNPNIRFKVNPKCYHRVCEACIDRHFASGKAPCPVAGCKHEVWKRDWRVQTFEDLKIEREVDIRKRVMSILNRREEEFQTKRDWDDFLELREEFVMNLSFRTEVAATNRRLKEYEQANAVSIKENAAVDRGQLDSTANRISTQAHKATATDTTGLVKGLKEAAAVCTVVAYDPFMGMSATRDYYEVRDDYPSRKLKKAKTDIKVLAGGFDFRQHYDESLLRAFAGLGCFVEDEKANHEEFGAHSTVAVGASNGEAF